MPLSDDDIKELRKHITLAKKQDLNFALSLGKQAADTALMFHRKKSGDLMYKMTRKAEGVDRAKGCFGTVKADSKVLTLTCETAPPSGIRKKLKDFFDGAKISVRIKIFDPSNFEFEADPDEDNEQHDAATAPGETEKALAATDDVAEAPQGDLTARLRAAQRAIAEVSGAAQAPLLKALKSAVASFKGGDTARATQVLDQIDAALAKPAAKPASPPGDASTQPPADTALSDAEARLETVLANAKSVIAEKPEIKDKLVPALTKAGAAIKAKDAATANAILDQIEAALDKLRAAPPPQPPPPPPPPPDDALLKALAERMRSTAATAKGVIAGLPDLQARVVSGITAVKDALAAKDSARARQLLDAIDQLLAAQTPDDAPDPRALAHDLRDLWDEAKSVTDKELEGLLSRIRSSKARNAAKVLDMGLSAWSAGANTDLMKALIEIQNAPPERLGDAAQNARSAFQGYRAFISSHPAVARLERNHYGLPVDVRGRLGKALSDMEKMIAVV